MRKQRLAGDGRGNQSAKRRQKQDAPTPKSQPNQQDERAQDPHQVHGSALCQEHVDVGRGALTEVVRVLIEKRVRRPPTLGAQHP
jgi:hypothetical protein